MVMNLEKEPQRKSGSTLCVLVRTASIFAITHASAAVAQQAGPASAAVAPSADTSQEIVVTGLRGSLQRNLDIKRAAPGVIDAISSEDIGKFPDSNVAASLQ